MYDGAIRAKPYPLQAQAAAGFDYAKHGVLPATHLVLAVSGDVVSGSSPTPHKRPLLHGVSGGDCGTTATTRLMGDPAREIYPLLIF